MRSIVQKADAFVAAEFNGNQCDKYIDHGIFIPKRIDFSSRYFEGLKTEFSRKVFNEIKKEVLELLDDLNANKSVIGSQRLGLTNFHNDIQNAKSLDQLMAILNDFFNSKYFKLETLPGKTILLFSKFKSLDNWLNTLKDFSSVDPNTIATSELGLLFLDRTRLRPSGFSIGEHVTSISLGPGDELTLEQKSSYKETHSVEDVIEREFELTLENTSESSFKDDSTNQDTTSTSETGTTSVNGGLKGSFESAGVPVDANAGASASDTTQQAVSNANTASSELARTVSQKISSKLRKNHKTTVTETSETLLETSTKRVIRNPNKGTSVTYNFFKIMQKIEAKIQRKGIRLCWAPFVRTPGRLIRQRMDQAELMVYNRAKLGLKTPDRPLPPVSQLSPKWKTGEPVKFSFCGLGISDDNPAYVTVSVKVDKDDIYTNNFKVIWPKSRGNAGWYYESTVLHSTDGTDSPTVPRREGDEFFLTIYIWSNGGEFGDVFFQLQVEVIPANKKYKKELLAYAIQLNAYYNGLATMINEMREDVKDEAHTARQQVLDKADIRSELLHGVISQYISPTYRDEGAEVELWHRIIDFDNIGFTLYPNWWNERTPMPEFPDTNFLNASWGRAFLPIRKGYEKFAVALIFGDKGKVFYQARNFADEFAELQKQFVDDKQNSVVTDIGTTWMLTTPTDGTHIETMLGATDSLDDNTAKDIKQLTDRAQAEIDNINCEIALKNQAQLPFNVNVTLD